MTHLLDSANHTFRQLQSFLVLIKSEEYTEALPIFSNSTMGMHVRHIIEFYQCLMKGILTGEMDYDARERSLLQETNIEYALACIENVQIDLSMIKEDKTIDLATEQNYIENKIFIKSSISRELSYVIEHTIHHFAIIKMGCMVHFPHIHLDKDFGVAYSTINYRNRVHSNLSA